MDFFKAILAPRRKFWQITFCLDDKYAKDSPGTIIPRTYDQRHLRNVRLHCLAFEIVLALLSSAAAQRRKKKQYCIYTAFVQRRDYL